RAVPSSRSARVLLLPCYAPARQLHSFPTRRSSDLSRSTPRSGGDREKLQGVDGNRLWWRAPRIQRQTERRHHALPIRGLRFQRRSEEHTSELQSRENLVCRLLLEKKRKFALICTCV